MERHFIREDVEREFLRTFSSGEGEIVRVMGVKLLNIMGHACPLWLVYGERQWGKITPYRFTCVMAEHTMPDGSIRLVVAVEVPLPSGLLTPAEEDAAIERAHELARKLRMAHAAIEAGGVQS